MSMQYIYPLKPHFYVVKLTNTGVYNFSHFDPIHRLWVLLRNASARRFKHVPTINVLDKNIKTIKHFPTKSFFFFFFFSAGKKISVY